MNKIVGTLMPVVVAGGLILAAAPDSEAATTLRAQAMGVAKKHIGDPYEWGAAGPDSFDCSGLLYYSYKKVGKTLPRVAQSQYNNSHHVSPSDRKPGDVIAIGTSSRSVYHIGIYAGFWNGHGWMLDSPHTGSHVGYHQIRWYTAGSPKAYYGRY